MATFYILPPREWVEQAVAGFVARLIPGLPAGPSACHALLAELASLPDTYLVHREDLTGDDPADDLVGGFGAEPGDAVVEVGAAPAGRPAAVRRWDVAAEVPAPAAAR